MDDLEHRTLRASERDEFLDLMRSAFGDREEFVRYLDAGTLVGPDDTLVARHDGRLVAAVQIFDKRIRLGREVVGLGGIGSVATHPDYERRGISTGLLRRAIDEMKARGHVVSLLFTSRISFYERLGWVAVPHTAWSIRRAAAPAEASRAFELSDLARIERIYDYYNLHLTGSCARDRSYWNEQLGYAGIPDETFRVSLRDGSIVAYARLIDFYGVPRIMEYGRAPKGAVELAALLAELAPEQGAVLTHRVEDAQLDSALRAQALATLEPIVWGDSMWRVLDAKRLAEIAGIDVGRPDAEVLTALFGGTQSVYWASDRF